MNIEEYWKPMDECCTYTINYSACAKLLLTIIARGLKKQTVLVDDDIKPVGLYGYDIETGSLLVCVYINHGRLTKHHDEYILIEQTINKDYLVYTQDGMVTLPLNLLSRIMSSINDTIETTRKSNSKRETFANHTPGYLTCKRKR